MKEDKVMEEEKKDREEKNSRRGRIVGEGYGGR